MAVSVILYEDNPLLRESIVALLAQHNMAIAGSFGHVRDVESQIRQDQADCILMDIDMPGLTGIEAVAKIRKMGFTMPIIMLTVFDDNESVFNAIKAGATGYLLKKHIATRLTDSIEEALAGGAPMSPAIARMVITSLQHSDGKDYQLTAKEKETLALLAKGNSYKMIGSIMDISLDTVRTHIKKIYEKLHVHSQTEAVSKAIQERLV